MQVVFLQLWTNKAGEPDGVSIHLAPCEDHTYRLQHIFGYPLGNVQEVYCSDEEFLKNLLLSSAIRISKDEWEKARRKFFKQM